jgi:hypothetical protein
MSSLNPGRTTLSFPEVKWLGRDGNPLTPFCARLQRVDRDNFIFFIFIMGHESRLTFSKICVTAPAHTWIFSHVQYCYNLLKMAKNCLPSNGVVFITSSNYVSVKICYIYVYNAVEWQTHMHCMRRMNYPFILHTVGYTDTVLFPSWVLHPWCTWSSWPALKIIQWVFVMKDGFWSEIKSTVILRDAMFNFDESRDLLL